MTSLEQQNSIIQMIHSQLTELMEENYNLYKDYDVKIAKEQDFFKHKNDLRAKTIYIVVKFGGASVNFGQTVLPVTFTVLSEQNKCDIAYTLLTDYVNKYNLESNQDLTIKQVYESPSVSSNFNVVYEGYRSIINVTAFFVISKNANFFEYHYLQFGDEITYYTPLLDTNFIGEGQFLRLDKEKFFNKLKENINIFSVDILNKEEIFLFSIMNNKNKPTNIFSGQYAPNKGPMKYINNLDLKDWGINFKDDVDFNENWVWINFEFSMVYENIPAITKIGSWDAIPDTQPFFNRSNFAETEIKTGHLTFSFTTFLLSNIEIVNDALKIALKKNSVNMPFWILITFKNEELNTFEKYKLLSVNYQQDLGDIPMVSLTFGM